MTVLAGMPHLISCHVAKRALLEQRHKDNRKKDEGTLSIPRKEAILQIARNCCLRDNGLIHVQSDMFLLRSQTQIGTIQELRTE